MRYQEKNILSHRISSILRLLPAETAHALAMSSLRLGLGSLIGEQNSTDQSMRVHTPFGELAHPFGLAAGFDKDASCLQGLSRLGFSFLEAGTLTPIPQDGNSGKRILRLPEQHALINRMGFNNCGAQIALQNVTKAKQNGLALPLGINAGKNKESADAIFDYMKILETFCGLGEYFVINVSSPNTPGLRSLANDEFLKCLMREIEKLPKLTNKIWLKLDCDLSKKQLQKLVATAAELKFAGLILTNTHRVEWPMPGGMSGQTIQLIATKMLEWAYEVHQGHLAMIGVGGLFSGLDAFEKIARGANALQIYTALIYRGPFIVSLLLEELRQEMQLRGFSSLSQVHASYYQR